MISLQVLLSLEVSLCDFVNFARESFCSMIKFSYLCADKTNTNIKKEETKNRKIVI